MKKKLKEIISNKKKELMVFSFLILSLFIFFIGSSFANLTPIQSIILTSKNASFEAKIPGSWQVEKSSKWISKGRARVTFDVDTTLITKNKDKDLIMVLDVSSSMYGDKLEKVKQDSIGLIQNVLSNDNNKVSLITFSSDSTILSNLSNDEDSLIKMINSLNTSTGTNYYQGLVNVDNILKNYTKEDDRDTIVLFLTDGYPNEDSPNQLGQYQYLKEKYPYIVVNGIQYEMGSTILGQVKEISDNQYIADIETLNNVLFDASVISIPYEKYEIIDYIDNNYFTLDSVDDIIVSQGKVKLENEDGKQKITWIIDGLNSGDSARLSMDLDLKDEYLETGGTYSTNIQEEVITKIETQEEDVISNETPILADKYKVTYDSNVPDGCNVDNIPVTTSHFVFDTVEISNDKLSCTGYQFKGWEIVTKTAQVVGEDYFIMPETDVIIRAKWSKLKLAKSMDGVVNTKPEAIMQSYDSSSNTDYHESIYKDAVTSIVTKDNLEIPTTAIKYWDVSELQDESVIAYIEDDGSGEGTYKVTIGGQGGIVANPDSAYLFNGFINVETIDLSYLDTSQVTDMYSMFKDCSNLVSINLSKFDTSNVTDMSSMFYGCNSIINLDLSHFNTINVTDMHNMFYDCTKLTDLDISNFNTSNVTEMQDMFSACESIIALDLSHFNTQNVVDMESMFRSCDSLSSLILDNFDTQNVTNMSYMFNDCSSLTSLNLSSFNTSNVVDMSCMFRSCSSLTSLNLSSFNTSNVVDMSYMFRRCSSLTSLNLSHFNTQNVTDMQDMFYNCQNLATLDFRNADFDVDSYSDMFHDVYANINIIVKDITAQTWIQSRLAEDDILNAVVTIANN